MHVSLTFDVRHTMLNIKKIFTALFGISLMCFSVLSFADWFTSSKISKLIKKADSGDKNAQFSVGSAYDFGQGAPHDGEKAKKYYLMAAEQGHAEAQNSLGSIFEAEGNYTEAASWYYQAVQQGHPLAMNSIAHYYLQGMGVPQDKNKGIELYITAANLGMPQAMYNLGAIHIAGEIVDKDVPKGCVWIIRAYNYSNKVGYKRVIEASSKAKEVVEKKLTVAEYKKCEEEGNSWTPSLKN